MRKQDRQDTLLSLISSSSISNQGELAAKLSELGFTVTQASVSRDLDELGVVKIDGRYTLLQRSPGSADFGRISFDTAGDNLIIGRCLSGLASAITVRIDSAGIAEIVGTIAGDDTILIAVKDAKAQTNVLDKVTGIFA
jgi:transcriptional regulator of arginine metabolism